MRGAGDLVVGIDSSTTATKAIAWNAGGQVLAQGRAALAMANPGPGLFEQNPDDWWRSTCDALRELTGQVDAGRIAAVAISNQRETFGLFAPDGTALAPGLVWLDDRAHAQEKSFGASFGRERVHAISGKPCDIIPCLYRILWFAEHHPGLFDKTAKIAEVHGYLTFRLTGNWTTSTASADPMGLLDMGRRVWSEEILSAAGIDPAKMLDLAGPGACTGEVTRQAAEATGLLPGTRVIAGGGDGQCAGTGAGMLLPGAAYVNLGSATVSGSFGARYAHDRAFRTEIAIAEDGYVYETCLRSGTFLVEWMAREMFRVDPEKRLDALRALEVEAAKSPIGAGGLIVLPYWQGCMTPHWDSRARGVIAGLSGSTRSADIYRALLEGISLEQAMTTNRVAIATGPIDAYYAVGGGAGSDLWTQILADAANRPVHRLTTLETSSLGAAMAAAKGAGWFESIVEAAQAMGGRVVATFAPDQTRAARYAELLAIHADLWPILSAWNARLSAFAAASH